MAWLRARPKRGTFRGPDSYDGYGGTLGLDNMSFIRYNSNQLPTQPPEWEVRHYIVDGKDVFEEWLHGLKDISGRMAVLKRIDRVENGNFGDHRFVGGDKKTQKKDIRKAQEFWANYRIGEENETNYFSP